MLRGDTEPQAAQRQQKYEVPPSAQSLRVTETPTPGVPAANNRISMSEEYELLVEDLRTAMKEAHDAAAEVLVGIKWRIGEAISNSHVYEKNQWGSGRFVTCIAEDLALTVREVYSCLEFYSTAIEAGGMDPYIETLPYRGKITWSQIKRNLSASKDPKSKGERPRLQKRTLEEHSFTKIGHNWTELDHKRTRWLLGLSGAMDPDVEKAPKSRQINTASIQPADETSAHDDQWS